MLALQAQQKLPSESGAKERKRVDFKTVCCCTQVELLLLDEGDPGEMSQDDADHLIGELGL